MAVVESGEPDELLKKLKRERPSSKRKLLVHERVEVRSVEEGFLGSWHSGIVVACDKKRSRCVRYDHLLTDDESGKLVEAVSVSWALDGVVFGDRKSQSCGRGNIRPLPRPMVPVSDWELHYGLCVDADYNDAWWEGVIFDHEDGAAERVVFFPDLGDEMKVDIGDLRITWDWDECTGSWRRRGNWIFLELIEELEEMYGDLPVSVKQMWYDVREKRGFKKVREWTSRERDLWKKMVSEVFDEYSKFLVKELCRRLELPGSLLAETREGLVDPGGVLTVNDSVKSGIVTDPVTIASDLESAAPGFDVDSAPEADMGPLEQPSNSKISIGHGTVMKNADGCSVGIIDESPQQCVTITSSVASLEPGMDQLTSVVNCDAPTASLLTDLKVSNPKEAISGVPQVSLISLSNDDGITSAGPLWQQMGDVTVIWRPISQEMLPQAEFCPTAINDYYVQNESNKSRRNPSMVRDVWKHLLYLGWKIDYSNDKHRRKRYREPDGKSFYSLCLVCKHLKESMGEMISSASQDDPRRLDDSSNNVSFCLEQPQESQNPDCRRRTDVPPTSVGDARPDYCSHPVMEYHQRGQTRGKGQRRRDLSSEAKKQLSDAGWVISLLTCKGTGRKVTVFKPPEGRNCYSLRAACKCFLDTEGTLGDRGVSAFCSFQENMVQTDTLSKVSLGESLMEPRKVKVRGVRKPRRKREGNYLNFAFNAFQTQINIQARRDVLQNGSKRDQKSSQAKDRNTTLPKAKSSKTSRAFTNLRYGQVDAQTTYALRSSKRVQEVVVPNSSHRNPRSTLSWLIDNNEVLPRAKVRYINRKDNRILAEGRITSKGIKCSCCGKSFSQSGFTIHAGSKCRRGGSNIILEDGRSLLDCQRLIMGRSKIQGFITEPCNSAKSNWQPGENDYICSVCHYGGDLMLCDQCPSSFHMTCLGLENIPEGSWYCPSCCCGTCGESEFKGDKEHTKAEGFLTCGQCEHKYHVGCLRNKQSTKLKPTWFCSSTCKKIFFRLQRLLGTQITVGTNNLTWSLLKHYSYGTVSAEAEAIENYSKLSVALGVMHECFEPVRDPHTKRDLLEDVIFCRGSELQRLNFQGFYTVILARNDELISVATIRVHGKKVAEVPLVGTRLQYRRLGMCRILMNELEKKLKELGVEKLVLPAVPSVLNTWTTSFGFSQMTASERLHFLDYTFLDFQDTIMCQKLLTNIPLAKLSLLKGVKPVYCANVCEGGEKVNIDGSSVVSAVYQAEQVEDGQIASQGQSGISTDPYSNTGNAPTDTVKMVKDTQNPECRPCVEVTETNEEFSANVTNLKRPTGGNFFSKCYKRRKKPIGATLVKVT